MAKRVAVLLVLLAACSKPPYVVKSTDGGFEVMVPGHWGTKTDLHASANLEVCNPFREQYLIAIIEKKTELEGMNLQQHSDTTRGILSKNVQNYSETGPVSLTINGCKAVQYVLRGKVTNIDVVYIHTTVESDAHFSQVLAWSLASKWGANESVLRGVIESFKKSGS